MNDSTTEKFTETKKPKNHQRLPFHQESRDNELWDLA